MAKEALDHHLPPVLAALVLDYTTEEPIKTHLRSHHHAWDGITQGLQTISRQIKAVQRDLLSDGPRQPKLVLLRALGDIQAIEAQVASARDCEDRSTVISTLHRWASQVSQVAQHLQDNREHLNRLSMGDLVELCKDSLRNLVRQLEHLDPGDRTDGVPQMLRMPMQACSTLIKNVQASSLDAASKKICIAYLDNLNSLLLKSVRVAKLAIDDHESRPSAEGLQAIRRHAGLLVSSHDKNQPLRWKFFGRTKAEVMLRQLQPQLADELFTRVQSLCAN